MNFQAPSECMVKPLRKNTPEVELPYDELFLMRTIFKVPLQISFHKQNFLIE